jgi:FtsP/CotA-like multicopper oxidase with cupredoxin domain
MLGISIMADRFARLDRRELMAGLGSAVLAPALPRIAAAQAGAALALHAKAGLIALRPGEPDTAIWSLQGGADRDFRYRRGDQLEITLRNELPGPTVLNWYGIGVPAAEPLAARAPLASAAGESAVIPLRQAGTFMCDLRLLGDAQPRPSAARAMVVAESEAVAVDRDEVLLIEDWRLRSDGSAIAPGMDPGDAKPVYTVNGLVSTDIPLRAHERVRFRFINGCQRAVVGIKIAAHEVRVMALDSQPAEPFLARAGAIVLAPGGRADVFIDAAVPPGSPSAILLHDGTEAHPIGRLVASSEPPLRNSPLPIPAPLPSNGLPGQFDLKNALRFDLTLGGSPTDWARPASFALSAAPAFRAKVGRAVVLALTNRANIAAVFHLHGHHFRLLDRLDDGWKPFWLDTLAVAAGQTQRIAFAAEHAGRWLLESMANDWAAPRLVRWYSVE